MVSQHEQPTNTAESTAAPRAAYHERRWAGHLVCGLICLSFVGLMGRLVYIHVCMRPTFMKWSEERRSSEVVLAGRRGGILDCRGRVLAGSYDAPTVYADPRRLEGKSQEVAAQLSPKLGMSTDEICKLLANPSSRGFVVLKRVVPSAVAEEIAKLKIDGVGVMEEPTRNYPMGTLGAHVLGFMGTDRKGLEGIERTMDEVLRPTHGKRVVYRDGKRRAIFQQADSYVAPKNGMHVVLTLDTVMQEIVEKHLAAAVEQYKAESGLCILLSPKTGAVLSLACYPTFDPGQPMHREPGGAAPAAWVFRNRVITDPVEPGSIFKPFVMTGTLAANLAKPEETIYCHNGLYVTGSRRLHDHHAYGSLSVLEILTKSSNIGMAILGQRLGNPRMHAALSSFGFGRLTGIDLPGESAGLMLPLKQWTSFSTTSVPMGHEMASTPIQLATAFAALANGGKLVKPYVVQAVVDAQGEIVEDMRPKQEPPQVLDAATVEVMRSMLVKVVSEGTGKPCMLDRWQVMGKTGTAQIPRLGHRGYEAGAYLGSFIAAAPASDPAVVALLMIRKPNARLGYYGGRVAAPAVKQILEPVLNYLDIPPDIQPEDRSPARLVSKDIGAD